MSPLTDTTLLTFGHGRLDRDGLAALLADGGVEAVVDVRRHPGSSANPAAARGQIGDLAAELGLDHRHDPRLGGRRSLSKEEDEASPDTFWEVASFRAYAAWTRSDEFRRGLAELLEQAASQRTAIMCSESVWWRCHRRIISDVVAVESGVEVVHLLAGGRHDPHPTSPGARLGDDGLVVWDGHR